jgi:transposase
VLRGERTDMFRVRQSTLEAYLPFLETRWDAGCRNGAELWRRSKIQGFRGSSRVIGEWAARRRRAEKASSADLTKTPSARTAARLMTTARDQLSKAESIIVAAIEARAPTLVEARLLIDRFQEMIRRGSSAISTPGSPRPIKAVSPHSRTALSTPLAAVRAAVSSLRSNGQTEGQITKLKLVQQQMYGRARIDLLEARLLGAA